MMFPAWGVTLSAAFFLSTTLLVSSFLAPSPMNSFKTFSERNDIATEKNWRFRRAQTSRLNGAQIAVFDFEDEDDNDPSDTRTDEEKGLTHGYEGDFKVGDVVKVKSDIRIWSVKQHAKDGFICKDYEGTVVSLALYGRKEKALCSAITPIRVQFEVNGKGVPEGFFERKWIAHFAWEELELISKAVPVEPTEAP